MMLSCSMLLVDRQALSEHTTTSSSTKSLGQALRVSLVKPGAYLSESYRHYSDPSPGCLSNAPPTAHGPPGPHGTAAPQTPSRGSSPPPITRRACPLDASWSRRGGPPPALAHTCGLPPLARRPPRSWPAPMGRSSPRSSVRQTPPPSSVASCASTSDMPPCTTSRSPVLGDHRCHWGRPRAMGRGSPRDTPRTPADAIDTR